ncbi:hypothetical protein HPB51_018371 [Rhipicephalus microplus]|uniref:Uncharacterized protein n=1 Tax=Rhipicephalus microplus TaxID=6941 RepID=A0A9J6ETR9_RHIMP|nr:hypothetical protein HPB51_018371 [Rhipicephalus microplus]
MAEGWTDGCEQVTIKAVAFKPRNGGGRNREGAENFDDLDFVNVRLHLSTQASVIFAYKRKEEEGKAMQLYSSPCSASPTFLLVCTECIILGRGATSADTEYQVDGESITPAEFQGDSRWIRAVKTHHVATARQPITSTLPFSTPSHETTRLPNTTSSAPTLRRRAPLPRLPAEDFKIVFSPGGRLDLRTTTNGVLLQTLCSLANIDYAAARTADCIRFNPYNNSLTVSTPYEPRACLYLHASELRLGTISYPLRAYMAAPDNALRGINYNAVDSQTQDGIIQNIQSMNLKTLTPSPTHTGWGTQNLS